MPASETRCVHGTYGGRVERVVRLSIRRFARRKFPRARCLQEAWSLQDRSIQMPSATLSTAPWQHVSHPGYMLKRVCVGASFHQCNRRSILRFGRGPRARNRRFPGLGTGRFEHLSRIWGGVRALRHWEPCSEWPSIDVSSRLEKLTANRARSAFDASSLHNRYLPVDSPSGGVFGPH